MTTTITETNTLNSLLRGEMSAIETYRQAIDKLGDDPHDPWIEELRAIQRDHRDAADALWHHIELHGGKPSEDSGPWGAFAKAIEGTAQLLGNLLGNKAALKALKEGEEHGLKDYEEALQDEDLPADCEAILRGLLPRQRAHIAAVDRLMARV